MLKLNPTAFYALGLSVWLASITLTHLSAQESISLGFGQTGYNFVPVIEQFQRQTGITIVSAPQEQYDLKAELIKRSTKKRLPDVFISPADYTTIQHLHLRNITTDWLNPDTSATALQTVMQNGEIKAIPLISGNHLVLYYNRDFVSNPAQTFEELKLQQDLIPSDKFLINWAFSSMYVFIPFLSAFDALPITNNQLSMSTPQMVQALEYYWQLPEQGLVNLSCAYECLTNAFESQNYAYIIDGVWSFKRYSERLGNNLGVATLPSIRGKPMTPYFSSHVLAIVEKSHPPEKLNAIQTFARYLQSEQVQTQMWRESGAIPANVRVFDEVLENADDNTVALLAQLDNSVPIPNTPYMAVVWEAMLKGFNRYGGNIMTAPQSAELMQHLAERTIEN